MTRDEFEQLVSAWLDEPDRDDLRARIDAAICNQPDLSRVLGQWQRLQALLGRPSPALRQVDWAGWRARVSAAAQQGEQAEIDRDHRLDSLLLARPSFEARVDWRRLHTRIAAAVHAADMVRSARRRWGLIAAGAGALATAAAVILALVPLAGPGTHASGLALLAVNPPPTGTAGVAVVRVAVLEKPEPPQCFFVIDPVQTTAPSEEVPDFY